MGTKSSGSVPAAELVGAIFKKYVVSGCKTQLVAKEEFGPRHLKSANALGFAKQPVTCGSWKSPGHLEMAMTTGGRLTVLIVLRGNSPAAVVVIPLVLKRMEAYCLEAE